MVSKLLEIAQKKHCSRVKILFIANDKNISAHNFLESLCSLRIAKKIDPNTYLLLIDKNKDIKTLFRKTITKPDSLINEKNSTNTGKLPSFCISHPVYVYKIFENYCKKEGINVNTLCNQSNCIPIVDQLFQNILADQNNNLKASFHSIGASSLDALRLIHGIFDETGVELTLDDVYSSTSLLQLKQQVLAAVANIQTAMLKTENLLLPPSQHISSQILSSVQDALYKYQVANPQSSIYTMPMSIRLQGELDLNLFVKALGIVIRSHPALRIQFFEDKNTDTYYQSITEDIDLNVSLIQGCNDIEHHIDQLEQTCISINEAPLFRIQLISLNKTDHIFILLIHHLLFDGWSYNIFFKDLSTAYRGLQDSTLSQSSYFKRISYLDTVNDTLSFDYSKQILFWRKKLDGLKLALIPADDLSKQEGMGRYQHFELSSHLTKELECIAARFNTTLFTVLGTAYDIFLHYQTNTPDVAFGTIVTTRNTHKQASIIGCFINALVLRTYVSEKLNIVDLLKANQKNYTDCLQNRQVPFGDLIEAMDNAYSEHNNPFYHAMFMMQEPIVHINIPGVKASKYREGYNIARSDIILELQKESRKIHGGFYFNHNYFSTTRINNFVKEYILICHEITQNVEQSVAQLLLHIHSLKKE
ncbi:hypothetical protein AB835_13725 [Candidatus Endobugula sertula]|uniref:Carrier domain-containing protein n=1 Tax=Candidatus Endobugula sertula TaxID=62101 RepID=A0A1D2QLS4_9GAMM|nr:hypothetical protein AB835_13725 [Candidatus Endobugula sertula]